MVAESRRQMDPLSIFKGEVTAYRGCRRGADKVFQERYLLRHNFNVHVARVAFAERLESKMAEYRSGAAFAAANEAQIVGIPVGADLGEGNCLDRVCLQLVNTFLCEFVQLAFTLSLLVSFIFSSVGGSFEETSCVPTDIVGAGTTHARGFSLRGCALGLAEVAAREGALTGWLGEVCPRWAGSRDGSGG